MNVKSMILGAVVAGSTLVTQAFAADFTAADELFERRGEGVAVINEGKDAYAAQLGASNTTEKLYALGQMSRLAYYEGLIVPESDRDARVALYRRCWDDLEAHINPSQVGDTVEYYFWKGVCMASWARAKGIGSSLAQSGELVETVETGLTLDDTYEGGGFYRLGSAVFQNLPPVNPFGPTRDLARSLEYAELAIESEAYAGEEIPDTATGDYFFNVYEYQAIATNALGDRDGAIAILEDAISRIQEGDVPSDRMPETTAFLDILQRLRSSL